MPKTAKNQISVVEVATKLDQIANQNEGVAITPDSQHKFQSALALADAASQLYDALTPEVMAPIVAMQGKRLGFKTDKQYPESVVRDCLIEATLWGVPPVGNHFNIIAGNTYITREGLTYLLRHVPGLKDLKVSLGIPDIKGDRAIVKCVAEWQIAGEVDSMEAEIPVRVNKSMGDDAILGKADRKMKKRVYDYIVGAEIPDSDEAHFEAAQPAKVHRVTDAVTDADPSPIYEKLQQALEHDGFDERDCMNALRHAKFIDSGEVFGDLSEAKAQVVLSTWKNMAGAIKKWKEESGE